MLEPTAVASLWQDDDLETSVAARFERTVARFPDRPALRSPAQSLTYDALNRWVNGIGHGVLDLRGDRPEPMALLLTDSFSSIAGILGAYKAGKISLHLDATLPAQRLRLLLDDSGAGLLASGGAALSLARTLAQETGIPLVDIGAPGRRPVSGSPRTRPPTSSIRRARPVFPTASSTATGISSGAAGRTPGETGSARRTGSCSWPPPEAVRECPCCRPS
jgi:acyl-CoA synthetase (AMP-forming)/AMP-acid ligase II